MDDLGLILRRDIIWSKPNGLPESVTDRCRSSHEYLFHFTRQPRYYAAVDEIREPHAIATLGRNGYRRGRSQNGGGSAESMAGFDYGRRDDLGDMTSNPLGKLPGSVWDIPPLAPLRAILKDVARGVMTPEDAERELAPDPWAATVWPIPSQPLTVPAALGVDHFAAFPMELPRRCVLGWSPPGVCTACGEGRRPVSTIEHVRHYAGGSKGRAPGVNSGKPGSFDDPRVPRTNPLYTITGYACACTPYTDHPGTGDPSGPYGRHAAAVDAGTYENVGSGWGGKGGLGDRPRVGPWREYHLEDWAPPPTRPALVLDPFGGTGTTALVAAAYGRTGISVDMSGDYSRLARWRTTDPAERAKAMMVAKPPPVPDGQVSLFDDWEAV
jgi:hypothetical protein